MKPIPGFPNYSITPDGRVFKGDKEILRRDHWEGYPRVRLTDPDGNLKNRKIHRLIANTYLGASKEVRHKDNDRSNIHLDNLLVGDRFSNAKDRLERGSYTHKTKVIGGKSFLIIGDTLVLPEKKLVFKIGHPPLEHKEDGVRYVDSEADIEKIAWTSPSNAKKHGDKHSFEMGLTHSQYVKKAIDAKDKKLKLIRQALDGSRKLRDPEGNILVLSRSGKVITYYKPSEKIAAAIECITALR